MPVRVDIKRGWDKEISGGIQSGLLELSTDIHRRAVTLAPRDTGALAGSGKVTPVYNGYKVEFGSGRVPYARRRHSENKKNPQTRGYLAKAGESVARGDTSKYFRNKV